MNTKEEDINCGRKRFPCCTSGALKEQSDWFWPYSKYSKARNRVNWKLDFILGGKYYPT